MKTNLVDIILPNYNKKQFLEETIISVIKQSLKNWRLFIIDNNSMDESQLIIEKYKNNKQINCIFLKKNMGVAFSRNLGMKLSNSKYIAFLDSDDIWHPSKLQNQINYMEKNKFAFTFTNYSPFKLIDGKKILQKEIIPNSVYNVNDFTMDTTIATSSMIINRNTVRCIFFNKRYFNEDYNFKCKILIKCKKAYNLNENLTFYRITKNSRSSYKLKSLLSIFKSNKELLNMNFLENIKSIVSISLRSIKKYGLK